MEEKMRRCKAVVLAAGSGKRMHSSQKKQFMRLCGRPVVCHSLQVFEQSFVDEVALVVSGEDIDYCRTEIVDRYGFSKVRKLLPEGRKDIIPWPPGSRALLTAIMFLSMTVQDLW